jgi:hypothetical protein
MPRQVFTPSALKTVRRLAMEGKTTAEIARAIGSTPASVRVKCFELNIALRTRGRPRKDKNRTEGKATLAIYLKPKERTALAAKAHSMQLSTADLAGELLNAVIGDDIYDAVLGTARKKTNR